MALATKPIAAAMHKAGYDTDRAMLHAAALKHLRKAKLNPQVAAAPFLKQIRGDLGLLLALIGDEWLGQFAQEYLEARAKDMRGEVKERGGTGHAAGITHTSTALPSHTSSEEAGALAAVPPNRVLPRSSGPDRGNGGHSGDVTHSARASTSRSGARSAAARRLLGRDPSPSQVSAMVKVAKQEAASVWGFKIAVLGMTVGDIPLSSVERGIYAAGRERIVLRVLQAFRDHKVAPDGIADRVFRDVMTEEQMRSVIEFATRAEKIGIEYRDDKVLLERALGMADAAA